MARTALLCTALLALVAVASACSTPPGACTKKACNSLKGLKGSLDKVDKRIGTWLGKTYNDDDGTKYNKRGARFVNFGFFDSTGLVIGKPSVTDIADCCNACRVTDGCFFFQFFEKSKPGKGLSLVSGQVEGKQCYLLSGGPDKTTNPRGYPKSGAYTHQLKQKDKFEPSFLGGLCNGNATVVDDPHFTGAMGTRFDFNGKLDQAFCLTTDSNLHINVMLRGYENNKPTPNTEVGKDGKVIHSWIKEIGFLWKAEGVQHKLHLVARGGKAQARGSGFLQSMTVDGETVAVPAVGETLMQDGGLSFGLVGVEKKGPFEVEHYKLTIGDLLEADLRMRVAHPALQTPDDAEVHFNVQLVELKTSSAVHGVLGQTYREGRAQQDKALKFSQLAALLQRPIVADGESGKGFLDGTPDDYISSHVLAADCKYGSF